MNFCGKFLAVSLSEQLGDSETGRIHGLVLGSCLKNAILTIIVGPEWGNYHNRKFYNDKRTE